MYDSSAEEYTPATTPSKTPSIAADMDAPTIQPKFLPKRNELGLVAVGFSGGQVCLHRAAIA